MAHIYNDPTQFTPDATAGFVAAYSRYVEQVPDTSAVMRRGGPVPGKVSVIIGGGSGHYPAFCGTVGAGLADGAVIGNIFTSPSTEQAYRTAKALDGGAGVLFSFGNYAGDVMNFGVAEQRLRDEGIDCRTVLVTDDVASAPVADISKRRGVAGDFIVFKAAGAAADRGDSIDQVEALARKANAATVSFGVAFDGCTFPGKDTPLFHVETGKMDLGLGIHGEPGIRTVDWMPARELAPILLQPLLDERPAGADRAAVILNGLGATKYEELFVLWGTVGKLLSDAGITVVEPEVGELVTSLDMAGCSLTIMWLDDELEALWTAPADTPAFRRGAVEPTGPSTGRHAAPADRGGAGAGASAGAGAGAGNAGDGSAAAAAAPAPAEAASAGSRSTAEVMSHCLGEMLAVVSDAEEELGRIDAVAGDGDHGVGMVRGLRAATSAAQQAVSAGSGASSTLAAAGSAWADQAGGTSGVLWGALLTATGAHLGNTADPTPELVAQAVAAGTDAMAALGKCEIGDKTMYDALRPFADCLTENVSAGENLTDAWNAAALVAMERAAATADLVPRLGRARPLAERSVGTPDAGATSMAMVLQTIGRVLSESQLPPAEPKE